MLIDQEHGFLPMTERELLLHRVERDRLPAVGAALVKLRTVLGIDLLILEILLVELCFADVMEQTGVFHALKDIQGVERQSTGEIAVILGAGGRLEEVRGHQPVQQGLRAVPLDEVSIRIHILFLVIHNVQLLFLVFI